MLETKIYTCEQNGVDEIDRNWGDLKTELLYLTEYRLESANNRWYKKFCVQHINDIIHFSPKTYRDINRLPQGLLAEVFFLNACQQEAIDCVPSFGEEDLKGVDFKIISNDEEYYFDVSINTSKENLEKKIKEGSFPTLFIPWKRKYIDDENPYMTYAERYLKYGLFEGNSFLKNIVSKNSELLDCLSSKILSKKNHKRKVFNNEGIDLSVSGIKYALNLKDVLEIVRRSIY